MIYLYWYLGIGAVALTLALGAHLMAKEKETESGREMLDALYPDRVKLSYRLMNKVVVPLITAMALVLVWPIAVYMKGKEVFAKKSETALTTERDFEVESSHLQEQLNVVQIESCELISDPMGAVPNVPFGHLNAAWKTFLEGVGADDELWSFTAPWRTTWGSQEIRTGYAVVREGVPVSHFLTMRKEVEDKLLPLWGGTGPALHSADK